MQIVYLGSFRLPNYDAAAARVLNAAKALRKTGHTVSFISWGGKYRETDLCLDGKYRVDGFEYVITNELDSQGGFLTKAKAKLRRGNKTKSILRQQKYIDAIITYNGSLTRWLIRFTEEQHIKLINDITEWYSYSELTITDWIPYAYSMIFTQRKVKNKIVISSYLDRFYKTTHNIVVPATCDASESKWHNNKGYAECAAGGFDGITLIYAGNPSRKDLLHSAINVVQRLIDENVEIRFLILGITRENYLNLYSDYLRTINLSEKIQFLGKISQDLVPAFYSIADFMVLLREPNRKSNAGFPTKFAEAFTSKTPVIANATSDIEKYLIDGKTGFLVSGYDEKSLYMMLKEKVITLTKEQMDALKETVAEKNIVFDYHFYIEPLKEFFNNLI